MYVGVCESHCQIAISIDFHLRLSSFLHTFLALSQWYQIVSVSILAWQFKVKLLGPDLESNHWTHEWWRVYDPLCLLLATKRLNGSYLGVPKVPSPQHVHHGRVVRWRLCANAYRTNCRWAERLPDQLEGNKKISHCYPGHRNRLTLIGYALSGGRCQPTTLKDMMPKSPFLLYTCLFTGRHSTVAYRAMKNFESIVRNINHKQLARVGHKLLYQVVVKRRVSNSRIPFAMDIWNLIAKKKKFKLSILHTRGDVA